MERCYNRKNISESDKSIASKCTTILFLFLPLHIRMERLPSLVLLIQHILLLFRSSLKFFGWSPCPEDDFPQACDKGKSYFFHLFFSVLSVCDVWNVPTLATCLPAYPGTKKLMCEHTKCKLHLPSDVDKHGYYIQHLPSDVAWLQVSIL